MEQVKPTTTAPATGRALTTASFRRFFLSVSLALSLAWPFPLGAAPLFDTRAGGLGLVGPASPHPASAFYNPAALELTRDHSVFFDATTRFTASSARRMQVDPLTGKPRDGAFHAEEHLLETFPQFYLGLSSTLGSESMILSLFACTPVAQITDLQRGASLSAAQRALLRPRGEAEQADALDALFDPAAQGPLRYQLVDMTLYHLYVGLAGSYRIIDELIIGASVNYVFGSLDLAFVRDAALDGGSSKDAADTLALDDCGGTPCNYESDLAAQAVRTRGVSHSLGFSVGVLVRPIEGLDIGLSYNSAVMGFGGDDVPAKGQAWVLRSAATLDSWSGSSPIYADAAGRSTVNYALPDRVNLGVTWRVRPWLGLNLQFRWLNLSEHAAFSAQLTGTEFREQPRLPDRLVLYRGFQDVFAVQLGAAVALPRSLELQSAVMVESAAVPTDAVTVAAIDGVKVDLFAALGWRFAHRFRLQLGYGAVVMPEAKVRDSRLSGQNSVTCVDSRYNVDLDACTATREGRGAATAAGDYFAMIHRVGLSFSYVYP